MQMHGIWICCTYSVFSFLHRRSEKYQSEKFWPYFTSSLMLYLFAVRLIFLLKLKQFINISHNGTNQIYGKTRIGFIKQSFSRMGHAVIVTQVIDPMKYCGR